MMSNNDLLNLRRKTKLRKPLFLAQDSHKKARVGNKKRWRKPKGLQSKIRLSKKGYRKMPSQGYRAPKAIRGSTREGLFPIVVNTLSQLDKLDKNNIIVLSSSLGTRKKIDILEETKKKGLKVDNIKDIDKFIENIRSERENKKKAKDEKKKLKETKEKKQKKKSDKDLENEVQKESDKEKKEREKREKDKLLTKTEA